VIAASKTLLVLRMVGFILALAWVGLLFVSFAKTSLHSLVNKSGPYVFGIIIVSLLVLLPLQRHLEKQANH